MCMEVTLFFLPVLPFPSLLSLTFQTPFPLFFPCTFLLYLSSSFLLLSPISFSCPFLFSQSSSFPLLSPFSFFCVFLFLFSLSSSFPLLSLCSFVFLFSCLMASLRLLRRPCAALLAVFDIYRCSAWPCCAYDTIVRYL